MPLTNYVELHEVAHLGLSADLALVHAGVARLHVLHLLYREHFVGLCFYTYIHNYLK